MQKKLLWILASFLVLTSAPRTMAQQVTSISGDGTIISNSGSTGAVTLTLENATAESLLGNSGSSAAAPSYLTSPTISGTLTAAIYNATTVATGYEIGGTPVLFLPVADTTGSIAVGGNALNSITTGSNNLGVGAYALQSDTAGLGNMGVGAYALQSDTTGNNNTGLGYTALQHLTTGNQNLAIGASAMQGVAATPLTGGYNTAVGYGALIPIRGAASYNTAIGYQALGDNTTGNSSTAVGFDALTSATGSPNAAVGFEAAYYITSGTNNTALGTSAMQGVASTPLTGSDNTAVGDSALEYATGAAAYNTGVGAGAMEGTSATPLSGEYNTAVGYQALYHAGATRTTAIGYDAGGGSSNQQDNTLVGYQAGSGITTGYNNIILGEDENQEITTGHDNIYIGNNFSGSPTANNQINIGGVFKYSGATTATTISGNVTATGNLTAEGNIVFSAGTTGTTTGFICYGNGNQIYFQSTSCGSSQRRLKENFVDISGATASADLMALKPTQFNFKPTTPPNPDPNATGTQYGFIAEEVAAVDPRLALYQNDMRTPKSWRQDSMIALLVKESQDLAKASQVQQKEIDDLKTELKILRDRQGK